MRIIVVDDDISSLSHFLYRIVDKSGFDYHFFKDDFDAILSYTKNTKVDGAFIDINMPKIDAIKLAEELVKNNIDMKIVFVTDDNAIHGNLPSSIKNNVLGYINKPIEEVPLSKFLLELKNKSSKLTIHTFGSFDCFINGNIVKFSSSKSKELFALLVVLNGKSLTMSQAITYLWPDKDYDKAKILYRDAVWRLRQVLSSINFNCVDFSRAILFLNKTNIECDYYDFLNGNKALYNNEFLISYDWSIEFESALNNLKAHDK